MNGESPAADHSTVHTQSPALLLISNCLVLIVKGSPQGLFELVLDGLLVLEVRNGKAGIDLAGID